MTIKRYQNYSRLWYDLEYRNIVWGPHFKLDQQGVERVQKRATRLIPNIKDLPYSERLEHSKLLSLTYRRRRGDMLKTYKIISNKVNIDKRFFPIQNHNSLEFQTFLSNFKNIYLKVKAENPFATFFTGDYNAHSQFWWPDGDTTLEGMEIDNLLTSLGLSQIISEPTHFEPNKNPSCIDLIITDQPNLILSCGTRASLD